MLTDESYLLRLGQVRSYKGIDYQMLNNAMYGVVNLPENNLLDGLYTSTTALFAAIDNLELFGEIPSKRG